ncbi:MAG: helix-turn-helix domain-containing protein [Candidatus Paceibacterota bacterium]
MQKLTEKNNSIWLNTGQVANLLGVTTRTIQNYRDQGILPFSQIGRVIRYRTEDVQEFLMAHYVKPSNWEGGVL